MVNFSVGLEEIREAQHEIQKYLRPTPLVFNYWLSKTFDCELYLKLENMQPIGSFKIRGAIQKLSKLTLEQKKLGVVAASAGNHAQGVAWGSQRLGIPATIIMPRNAPLVKIQNTQALGAEVILEGNTYADAFSLAQKISAEGSRKILIHAYEDPDIIAGQGTIALEILEQIPGLDVIVGAVGGGGLMGGVSTVFKELLPHTEVVACQASGATAMIQSIQAGKAVTLATVHTIADGIAISKASETMRTLLKNKIDLWCEADDILIQSAILTLLEKAKIVAEGAGAIPLACLTQIKDRIRGKKVVLIVSGGNIDLNVVSRLINRREQRPASFSSGSPGSPGSAGLVAKGNIY